MSTNRASYNDFILKKMGKYKVPGLSMAIIEDGKIVFNQSFGVKCEGNSQNLSKDTLFEGASFTKPLVGYLTLKLCDKGVLDLNTPLYTYLDEPYLNNQPLHKLITATHVLNHSTGFPNWSRDKQLEVMFAPGERFQYSGEGFVYLQKVLEHLTNKDLNTLVNEYVFKPFNMKNSSLVWDDKMADKVSCRHDRNGKPSSIMKAVEANAAYSLYCTSEDYANFLVSLINIPDLLSNNMKELFYSRQMCFAKNYYWGLSWGVELGKKNRYWHWGDNGGFKSYFEVSPQDKQGIVILTNSFYGLNVCKSILGKEYKKNKSFNKMMKLTQGR